MGKFRPAFVGVVLALAGCTGSDGTDDRVYTDIELSDDDPRIASYPDRDSGDTSQEIGMLVLTDGGCLGLVPDSGSDEPSDEILILVLGESLNPRSDNGTIEVAGEQYELGDEVAAGGGGGPDLAGISEECGDGSEDLFYSSGFGR